MYWLQEVLKQQQKTREQILEQLKWNDPRSFGFAVQQSTQ